MSSIDAAADTRGVANEAEDEPLTVCEEAVRRMSFDSQDKEALAGGDRKPPIVQAQRAKPGTSALSTMLEAVSPIGREGRTNRARNGFKIGVARLFPSLLVLISAQSSQVYERANRGAAQSWGRSRDTGEHERPRR